MVGALVAEVMERLTRFARVITFDRRCELEVMDGDLGGLAVHIAARVMDRASASEVLVSSTVKDLVVGSGIGF